MAKDTQAGREVVPAEAVEVVDPATRPASMSKTDARKLTGRIRKGVADVDGRSEKVAALLAEAKAGKAWAALGYASWGQYVATEFQMSRSRSYQLVNWELLNRELEAVGEEPAATEWEARQLLEGEKSAESKEADGGPVTVHNVDTGTAPEQQKRATADVESVEEQQAPVAAEPDEPEAEEPPLAAPKTPAPSARKPLEEQVHDLIDTFLRSNPEKVAALDTADPALANRRASDMEDWADRYRKAALRLKAKGSKDPAKCQHPQSAHRSTGEGAMVECDICGTKAWSGVSLLRMGARAG